jgi:valyl-tRNA synthetase
MDTLYTALEGGLTMIHPFMPFLTEELWQRLPRRPGDATPSIMKASYPQYNPELDDVASEAAYELILGCSKGIRSLLGEYSIINGAKGLYLCACLRVEVLMVSSSCHPTIRQRKLRGGIQ